MSEVGQIFVNVGGRDVGLAELLDRLDSRMRATNTAGNQLGDVFGRTVPAAQQRSADAALRHAQSVARLAQSMGDNSRAANILTTALAQNAGASDRAVASITGQLSRLESGKNLFTEFGAAGKSALLGIVGPAAAVSAAIGALGQLDDLARLGAQAEQTAVRFDRAARAAGTTGEAFTKALRAASSGTISDLNLQLAANRARLLGVADSAEKLAPILAIARDRAQEMGISTTQAFNDLVTGLGRGSPLILDNLGITLSVAEANKTYADAIGKTVSALTEAEQKQALINAVMLQGQTSLAASGGAFEGAAASSERFAASLANLKATIGAGIASGLADEVEGLNQFFSIGDRVALLQQQLVTGASSFAAYSQQAAFANTQLAALGTSVPILTEAQFQYAQSLIASGTATDEAIAKAGALADVSQLLQIQQQAVAQTSQESAAVLRELGGQILQIAATSPEASSQMLALASSFAAGEITADQFRIVLTEQQSALTLQAQIAADATARNAEMAAMDERRTFTTQAVTQATNEQSTAMIDQIAKQQQATLSAQELAEFQSLLARLGSAVAGGHMTAGAAAVAMGNQYAFARDRAWELVTAQAALAKAEVARADLQSSSFARANRGGRITQARETAKTITERRDLAKAEEEYQRVLGNTGPALARVKSELGALTPGTAAYTKKLTELARVEKERAAALKRTGGAGGGGGGGAGARAGAVKLTEQQKINNTLFADQERFNDQLEQAETQHQERILDIERDFAEKSREAQKEFDQDRFDSRASFYEGLAGIEDQGLRQSMSAQFEAAALEAQKIAETEGADAGQAFLDASRAAIEKQAQLQQQIAEAREKGDTGQAEFLEGVLRLQQQADEARLNAIRQSGSAIAAERDKQLSEEERRMLEQTGKIETAVTNKAERTISAAQREGKAIADVNQVLLDQEAITNRIGGRGSTPGVAGGAPATPAVPAGAQGVAIDLSALASQLQSVVDAIHTSTGSITRAQHETTGAVRGLGERFMS